MAELEITPEPSDAERTAILAALAALETDEQNVNLKQEMDESE